MLDGKFQIERALASGASGDVYEAIHLGLGSRVAVKVLRPGLPQTAHIRRKRFVREARVAARIQSDYVVRVFDIVAPEHGLIYIVMELLLGETLAERIRRVGAMPPLEAVGYVLQAAKPLAAMHDAGIVHRDVKPSNIFLARDTEGNERVKLLDFGVAALQQPLTRGERTSAITFTDAMVGTPRYMAPEQVHASKDVEACADVWALGVTLYEMLAGRQPFDGQTVLAVLNQIETQEPPSLVGLRPGVPPELAKIVHACLAKDPARRPKDARALGEALAPFGGGAFRGDPAPMPGASDPLDLSLSDENVEVVREIHAPPKRPAFAALLTPRTWIVAGGVTLLVATLVFAASGRSSAPRSEDSVAATVGTPAVPAPTASAPSASASEVAAPVPAPTTTEPSRTAPAALHAAASDTARVPPAARRPGKSPARAPAAKVTPGRNNSDDDDRIE